MLIQVAVCHKWRSTGSLTQKSTRSLPPTHLSLDRWPMGCHQLQGTPILVALLNDEDMIELAKPITIQIMG